MKFDVLCTEFSDDRQNYRIRKFVYDNATSQIHNENGELVVERLPDAIDKTGWKGPRVSRETPGSKHDIRTLKIQLGLSCNYSCEYCSQRFVPHADETSHKHVDKFVKNLDLWITEPPEKVEFWGGEPLVYYKTLKPLAEAIRKKWPESRFLIITNGSLLNPEINKWLAELNFSIGISHDGPGQHVRGPDPLDDPEQMANIEDLIYRTNGRVSFNAMMNRHNLDRWKVAQFFIERFGRDIRIGEGAFIDAYDEGGLEESAMTVGEHYAFRRLAMDQLRKGLYRNYTLANTRLQDWIKAFHEHRPSDILGQKCGMDRSDTIAVDLRGNVITCQNVSAAASKDNGQQHLIGHVSRLDQVKLDTSTHWSFREECVKCPLLQGCKGSCMFLDGEKFQTSCNTSYSDHLPFFAAAFEMVTGCLPFGIIPQEGDKLPDERADLWGPSTEKYELPSTNVEKRTPSPTNHGT